MYLGGFIHRDKLFEIATRWLADDLQPNDSWELTEIFTYEGFVSSRPSRKFILNFFTELYGKEIYFRSVKFKHQVKEAVVKGIKKFDNRLELLVRNFKNHPEEYFPRAPFDGFLIYTEDDELVGMYRVKRARRVAEKVSRRLADNFLSHIKKNAENLAQRRARLLGIPLNMLMSSREEMVTEFEAAERQLSTQFSQGSINFRKEDIALHDVIGFKVIGDQEILARAESIIRAHDSVTLEEKEHHTGSYNAVNFQLDLQLPPPGVIIDRTLSSINPPFPVRRGISYEDLLAGFPTYVESGRSDVKLEVILTDYDELVESEIGRSIHEERTLKQRKQREYTGRIAKNAEFIIEYLLSVAFFPKVDINFLPVKLLGHYLPETISYAIRELYDMEKSSIFHTVTF
ncbi:MAG: hypothetical protein ACQES9_05095 [Myxococcota bacterium]